MCMCVCVFVCVWIIHVHVHVCGCVHCMSECVCMRLCVRMRAYPRVIHEEAKCPAVERLAVSGD